MSRIARLVIFDGTEEALAKQLGNSLSEGVHIIANNMIITVIKLSVEPVLNDLVSRSVKDIEFWLMNGSLVYFKKS